MVQRTGRLDLQQFVEHVVFSECQFENWKYCFEIWKSGMISLQFEGVIFYPPALKIFVKNQADSFKVNEF